MRAVILVVAMLLPLAGCLGAPPGTVSLGDTVSADIVVRHAETGEVLLYGLTQQAGTTTADGGPAFQLDVIRQRLAARVDPMPEALTAFLATHDATEDRAASPVPLGELTTLLDGLGLIGRFPTSSQFEVGTGGSGLGFPFERGFLGQASNESLDFETPPLEFSGEVRRERFFGQDPSQPILLTGQIARQQFENAFGTPTEGQEFTPPLSFYTYRVESVGADTVEYVALPEDGQRDPVPHVGSVLVTHVMGDRMVQELEPVEGATFTIQPPSPFNPSTPLDLDPGSYQVLGGDGTQIILAFHPTQFADIIGHPLRFEVTVTSVQEGESPGREPVDGNFGVRTSPQVNGRPNGTPVYDATPDGMMGHEH